MVYLEGNDRVIFSYYFLCKKLWEKATVVVHLDFEHLYFENILHSAQLTGTGGEDS